MIKEALETLIRGENLSVELAYQVMCSIMEGKLNDSQLAAYLVALRCKGETVDEIVGSTLAIRRYGIHIKTDRNPVVDTCGTGGDASGSFNISTVSTFVIAGAGVAVAKHGNRAVSSRSGSADLLETLGVNIQLSFKNTEECLNKAGIGFLFAPLMHPAMAHAVPVRKTLGIRTIFNILGPLCNPAGVKRQVIGVYNNILTKTLAEVVRTIGVEHALIVCGVDGMDEITLSGETQVVEIRARETLTYRIKPEDFGFNRVPLYAVKGRDAEESAQICMRVLKGEKGPHRDVVLLNSAAALYVAGSVENLKEGIVMAQRSIESGAALDKLRFLQRYPQKNALVKHKGGIAYA